MTTITKTLKVRVRDKHAKVLRRQAAAVNRVWNYVNELSSRSIRERGQFLSAFDLHPYTQGAGKLLGLHSQTVQMVAQEYVIRRNQFRKQRLAWRKTHGVRRSLGWVPVNTGAATWRNGQVHFNRQHYKVWDSYELSQYRFRSGCFVEDARGRWYFCVAVTVKPEQRCGTGAVGVDLGLKTTATPSEGEPMEAGRFYRDQEQKLAIAQRARKKTPGSGDTRQNPKPTPRCVASIQPAPGQRQRPDCRWQCLQRRPGQNESGQVGARRRLVATENPAVL